MNESTAADAEPVNAVTDRYTVDGRSSRFTVRAFATGMLAAMGHKPTIGVRDLKGEVDFNPERLTAGSFRLAIQASSRLRWWKTSK